MELEEKSLQGIQLFEEFDLPLGWRYATLGELSTIRRGASPRPAGDPRYFGDGTIPWIKIGDVTSSPGRYVETTAEYVNEEGAKKSVRIPPGSLIIANSGVSLGFAAITMFEGCIHDGWLLLTDLKGIDQAYLFYCINEITAKLRHFAEGTTQPNLNTGIARRVLVPRPPLPEQKAIAHVLGSLDDKIELNRRMNETLEGMAQALFKSWFVDFDPVIDNALAAGNPIPEPLAQRAETRRQAIANGTANRDTAKAFPASFRFTQELGWIPEGWEVDSIYQLMDIIYGAPFKSKMFTEEGEGTPVIRIRDLKTGTPQNWTTEDHPKKTLIKAGYIVVGMDAEFRATIWPGEDGYLNQRLFYARPKNVLINSFFIQKTLQPHLEYEENTQVGTTVAHLGKKEIEKFKALIPDKETLSTFEKSTTPVLHRLTTNFESNRTLAKLRDALLPMLISGELRIPQAEKMVEEAVV